MDEGEDEEREKRKEAAFTTTMEKGTRKIIFGICGRCEESAQRQKLFFSNLPVDLVFL